MSSWFLRKTQRRRRQLGASYLFPLLQWVQNRSDDTGLNPELRLCSFWTSWLQRFLQHKFSSSSSVGRTFLMRGCCIQAPSVLPAACYCTGCHGERALLIAALWTDPFCCICLLVSYFFLRVSANTDQFMHGCKYVFSSSVHGWQRVFARCCRLSAVADVHMHGLVGQLVVWGQRSEVSTVQRSQAAD